MSSTSPTRFLHDAVEFVNERLWGTLSAALTVPPGCRRGRKRRWVGEAVARLRYGMVGINHWPGTLYGLASPPWGAEPGRPLNDVQSGRGWVHNAYLLNGVEKTVLEGPLTLLTTPIWFPTRWDAAPLAWETLHLCYRPTLRRLTRLLINALKGEARCGI
ncbi:MAG: hypothetical protein GXP27_17610 [Planctomycetes bacterium]|nr:hypothetical protein [Planctomycetota bacterium]